MAWTYEQRMERAIAALVDADILDANASSTIRRARFFNRYAFRVSMSPTLESWHRYDELREKLAQGLHEYDPHIVAAHSTYDYHVYGNEPKILRWIQKHHSAFFVNKVVQTDKAHWNKPLPKVLRKGKFFGEYRFRLQMKQKDWGAQPQNINQLAELDFHNKLVCRRHSNSVTPLTPEGVIRDTFIYVDKLNEVLVLKLMFADQVAEVEDRV